VKKEEVWFWTNDLEIFGGEVYNWDKTINT
jgi:hypothetical protein